MKPPTPAERRLLRFIARFGITEGHNPNVRQMANEMGHNSLHRVECMLDTLRDLQLLHKADGIARSAHPTTQGYLEAGFVPPGLQCFLLNETTKEWVRL